MRNSLADTRFSLFWLLQPLSESEGAESRTNYLMILSTLLISTVALPRGPSPMILHGASDPANSWLSIDTWNWVPCFVI